MREGESEGGREGGRKGKVGLVPVSYLGAMAVSEGGREGEGWNEGGRE